LECATTTYDWMPVFTGMTDVTFSTCRNIPKRRWRWAGAILFSSGAMTTY